MCGPCRGGILLFIPSQYVAWLQDDFVWLDPEKDGEFAVAIGARVLQTESGRTKVVDDDGRELWVDSKRQVRRMHPTSIEGVEDMISLGEL